MLELSAQDIKDIRKKYGLSQKSFAKLLGIGEASIARYETGAVPTRANKNLISAAADPSFMAECLKHNGELLSDSERRSVEWKINRLIDCDKGEKTKDITELFEIDMMREELNERAAQLVGELFTQIGRAEAENNELLLNILNSILRGVGEILPTIVMHENASLVKQAEIKGKLTAFEYTSNSLWPHKFSDAEQPELFTPEELQWAVNRFLVLLLSNPKVYPVENPSAVFIRGQMGSGKTNLQDVMLAEKNNNAIVINRDLYQRLHPRINDIIEIHKIGEMPCLTSLWVEQFVESFVGVLSRLHYNLIFENTPQTSLVPLEVAQVLTERGYDVQVAALAVNAEVSLLSNEMRLKRRKGNATYPLSNVSEIHYAGAQGLVKELEALEKSEFISGINVYSRTGELLFSANENTQSLRRPSEVVREALFDKFTPEELRLGQLFVREL